MPFITTEQKNIKLLCVYYPSFMCRVVYYVVNHGTGTGSVERRLSVEQQWKDENKRKQISVNVKCVGELLLEGFPGFAHFLEVSAFDWNVRLFPRPQPTLLRLHT